MARLFSGGSYISAATIPGNVGNSERTIAFWFRTTNAATRQFLYSEGDDSGSWTRFAIEISSTTPNKLAVNLNSQAWEAATSCVSDTWYHVAVRFLPGTFTLWLNGAQDMETVGLTAINTTGNGFNIGRFYGGALALTGQMAEVCKFNSAPLSNKLIIPLSQGHRPTSLDLPNLAFYAPLIRDVQDLRGLALTDNGPTSASDHPRVFGK